MTRKYTIFGYDKDDDVYEAICEVENYARAHEIGTMLAKHQFETNNELVRRNDNGEPFDWFVLQNKAGADIMVFTNDAVSGKLPGNNENTASHFERLKIKIINAGQAAIEDFIGDSLPTDTCWNSTAEISALMDETWMQMPWEELKKFYEKYGIDIL